MRNAEAEHTATPRPSSPTTAGTKNRYQNPNSLRLLGSKSHSLLRTWWSGKVCYIATWTYRRLLHDVPHGFRRTETVGNIVEKAKGKMDLIIAIMSAGAAVAGAGSVPVSLGGELCRGTLGRTAPSFWVGPLCVRTAPLVLSARRLQRLHPQTARGDQLPGTLFRRDRRPRGGIVCLHNSHQAC